MKKVIGSILFVFWLLTISIGVFSEPSEYDPVETAPEWAGWLIVILWLGLPFVWGWLLKDKIDNEEKSL